MVWKLDPKVREALPTEWMKTSWDRWKMLQGNQTPLPKFDVWTESSPYVVTETGDYVLTVEANADAEVTSHN